LIEGSLKVEDLPKVWNSKMKEYLGVKVPSDAQGVLQDIHWSHGSFGYFPTYTLGNVYSAQLFNKIEKDIPNLESKFSKGDFSDFKKWLNKNIHQYGRTYSPEELIKKATGEAPNSKYLIDHLKTKI
jgi:carboxypeptidase Taq